MMSAIWSIISESANWSVETILLTVSLIFAVVGGAYSIIQLASAVRSKRMETLCSISEKYLSDEDIQEAMQIVSYDQTMWYSLNPKKPFIKDDLEMKIDKMLTFYSYICYLLHTKNLTYKEYSFFQYDIASVCEKAQTQLYLWDLWKIAKLAHSPHCYRYLVKSLIEEGIIDPHTFSNIYPTNEVYVNEYVAAHIKILKNEKPLHEAEAIVKKEAEKYRAERKNSVIDYQSYQNKKENDSSVSNKMKLKHKHELIRSLMKK